MSSTAPTEDSLCEIEEYEEVNPYVRKSPEAIFGTKRIGWAVLPDWLNEAVLEIIKGKFRWKMFDSVRLIRKFIYWYLEHDKETIRHDAKRIYQFLQSNTGYNLKFDIDFKVCLINFYIIDNI